jgi:hypothetical protein
MSALLRHRSLVVVESCKGDLWHSRVMYQQVASVNLRVDVFVKGIDDDVL